MYFLPLSLRRRSVLLQPQRLHPHHLHLPVQRAQEGGDDGASQPAGLRSLPGGPAVSPVGAALSLHAGPHGDGRPVREDALAGQPEEHQLRGAGDHTGGRPAQIQHQVCISKSSKQENVTYWRLLSLFHRLSRSHVWTTWDLGQVSIISYFSPGSNIGFQMIFNFTNFSAETFLSFVSSSSTFPLKEKVTQM